MVVSLERFVGKAVVVTGAGNGIGQAIAEKLVEAGLVVVGFDIQPEGLEETSKRTSGKAGKFHSFVGDVTKEEDVIKVFTWAADNLGPVHVLVNAAGIFIFQESLMDGEAENWRKVFDVNVIGLSIATREAIRGMRAAGIDGHIVHIDSIVGHNVPDTQGVNVYPASKFAVTALTESLRQELRQAGSKIKISSVSPGAARTNIMRNYEKILNAPLTMPLLEPTDVADGVAYVLSTPPHVQVHDLIIKPVGERES